MGQTGRRSLATHILAAKIALAAAHFHDFGVARPRPLTTWVDMGMKKAEAAKSLSPSTSHNIQELSS
jgi:hypothetical protein